MLQFHSHSSDFSTLTSKDFQASCRSLCCPNTPVVSPGPTPNLSLQPTCHKRVKQKTHITANLSAGWSLDCNPCRIQSLWTNDPWPYSQAPTLHDNFTCPNSKFPHSNANCLFITWATQTLQAAEGTLSSFPSAFQTGTQKLYLRLHGLPNCYTWTLTS